MRSTRVFLFTGFSGTGKTMPAEVIARISARHPYIFQGCAPASTPLAQSSRVYFGGFAPDFPHYISGNDFKKMKTLIVYDLDSQMSDDGASFDFSANVSQNARKPRCKSERK
jgi:hypothetical protein